MSCWRCRMCLSLRTRAESAPLEALPPTYPANLTAREAEVRRGCWPRLTYAEIADKLIITRRTVNGHVTSIYSKLGVNGAAATRVGAGVSPGVNARNSPHHIFLTFSLLHL